MAALFCAWMPAPALAQPAPTAAPQVDHKPDTQADTAADTTPRAAPQKIDIKAHYDNALGSSDAASQGVISAELLKSRPAMRPGEVLEFVPGVIVTQHSGDGKANQYFLRGFNLDHGTDFATSVNAIPVNMPSHAHGQGYTDLNFLLPELVQRIEYRKGPYFARGGDFASAGSADIVYRTRLDEGLAQLTVGQHGYRRGVLGASTDLSDGRALLGAVELMANDGPWTVPERLRKANAVVTLSEGTSAQGWQASAMAYSARWTSTDQVPQRLIDAGSYQGRPFSRFDSLDASDGGDTSRYSLSAQWHRRDDGGVTRVSAYLMRYALNLASNFTYALERPASGDQFVQSDQRSVAGLSVSHAFGHDIFGLPSRSEAGLQLRLDRAEVALFDSAQRQRLGTTRMDAVRQGQLGMYLQSAIEIRPWLRSVLGWRADVIDMQVRSLSLPANSGQARAGQGSPKLALVAGPWAKTEVFFNVGRGLHSNDARGATGRIDPRTGEGIDPAPPLAASRGAEWGLRTEAVPGLQSSLALWRLNFASELVYAGDAGSTEASAASRRRGVEFNNRWTPAPWLLLDADLAWTHARYTNGQRIPNAVDRVASFAVALRDLGAWDASLQWRYLGPGALSEDNSVRSPASITSNLRVSRKLGAAWGKNSELTLDVFNLFNRAAQDIQYLYVSQLPGEARPVLDRHVHPAEPRSLRLSWRLGF